MEEQIVFSMLVTPIEKREKIEELKNQICILNYI